MTASGNATDLSRRGFMLAAAAGTATAATAGTATAQDDGGTTTASGEDGGNESTTSGGSESGGGGTETVAVGPDGDFVFTPGTDEPLYVTPGTTVNFVWESNTHNIVVDSQPADASWEGHETIEDSGFEYEYTFEVEGTYEYFCQPHQTSGMTGTIEVTTNPPTPEPANTGPQIPPPAKTMGLVATATMVSTLGVAYFFLKYGDD